MNYIPASELERILLERRAPALLGMPVSIYLNELCQAPFSSPVAATRAAMKKAQEMAGTTPLPWYNEASYGSEKSVCDSHELRASIFCFPMPLFPHPSEAAKNPEFVCGWNGVILISAWRPLTLADREPQPGDVYRRWHMQSKRYCYCYNFEKFNDGYNYIELRDGNRVACGTHSAELLNLIEYVGTIKQEIKGLSDPQIEALKDRIRQAESQAKPTPVASTEYQKCTCGNALYDIEGVQGCLDPYCDNTHKSLPDNLEPTEYLRRFKLATQVSAQEVTSGS